MESACLRGFRETNSEEVCILQISFKLSVEWLECVSADPTGGS